MIDSTMRSNVLSDAHSDGEVATRSIKPFTPSLYWDIRVPKSYNCLFNFIVGMRGNGKTYGTKKEVIRDFLRDGSQFVYLRRYKEELKKVKVKYFDDILDEFPDVKLECKHGNFYINDKLAGYSQALSTSKVEKSNPFARVTWLCFQQSVS